MKHENNQHMAYNRTRRGMWSYGLMVLFLTLGVWGLGLSGLTYAIVMDPDINDDGIVNILDLSFTGSCIGANLIARPECAFADIDNNNEIGTGDYFIVFASFGQTFPIGPNPLPSPPGFSGGTLSVGSLVFPSFVPGLVTVELAGTPMPEPSTMLLLGTGLVGLIGYRMKKAQA